MASNQTLRVRHKVQWVDLRHQNLGGNHVELDEGQEWLENLIGISMRQKTGDRMTQRQTGRQRQRDRDLTSGRGSLE